MLVAVTETVRQQGNRALGMKGEDVHKTWIVQVISWL